MGLQRSGDYDSAAGRYLACRLDGYDGGGWLLGGGQPYDLGLQAEMAQLPDNRADWLTGQGARVHLGQPGGRSSVRGRQMTGRGGGGGTGSGCGQPAGQADYQSGPGRGEHYHTAPPRPATAEPTAR